MRMEWFTCKECGKKFRVFGDTWSWLGARITLCDECEEKRSKNDKEPEEEKEFIITVKMKAKSFKDCMDNFWANTKSGKATDSFVITHWTTYKEYHNIITNAEKFCKLQEHMQEITKILDVYIDKEIEKWKDD